jgi:hypothetical protein
VRREKLESAASANFAGLPGWQSGTGKGVLAKLLDAQSSWYWEEKQLLCTVVDFEWLDGKGVLQQGEASRGTSV